MKITCPNCSSSYTVADDMLGPNGRKVKCANCQTVWLATPDAADPPALASAEAASQMVAAEVVEASTTNDQSDIDALFGASGTGSDKEESQDDIDAMFSSDASEDQSQGDIDAMFASAGDDAAKQESQADIDALFGPGGGDTDTAPAIHRARREADADSDGQNTEADAWSAAISNVEAGHPAPRGDTIDAVPGEQSVRANKKGSRKVRLKGSHKVPSAFELYATRALKVVKPATVLFGLVALGLAFPMRDHVVRLFPDLAGAYAMAGFDINVRGVTFSQFTAQRVEVSGLQVLRVGGTLTNVNDGDVPVGPLRFALVADDGAELFVWRLEPEVTGLSPGQTLPVVTELTAPPNNVANVSVRFLQRGERIPGG